MATHSCLACIARRNVPNHANGSTLARDRCLQWLGWDLVVVPWFEWQLQLSQQDRQAYLMRKLGALSRAAGPASLTQPGAQADMEEEEEEEGVVGAGRGRGRARARAGGASRVGARNHGMLHAVGDGPTWTAGDVGAGGGSRMSNRDGGKGSAMARGADSTSTARDGLSLADVGGTRAALGSQQHGQQDSSATGTTGKQRAPKPKRRSNGDSLEGASTQGVGDVSTSNRPEAKQGQPHSPPAPVAPGPPGELTPPTPPATAPVQPALSLGSNSTVFPANLRITHQVTRRRPHSRPSGTAGGRHGAGSSSSGDGGSSSSSSSGGGA